MLVDLTPYHAESERRAQVAKEHSFEFVPQWDEQWKEGTGIYQCNMGANFSHEEFEEFKDDNNIPFKQSYELFAPHYEKSQYGVADNVEQLKEYFKEEIEDQNRKYFIALTPVFQEPENKGRGGGWRWYKWGPYIGTLPRECEYLDDEDFGPDFEYIICFHIYEIL